MPSDEPPARFRWHKKFIRTDAEQPCGTARMTLSFLSANQWVLFEWKRPNFDELYACMKKEVLPRLASAEPELTVAQALRLERSLPSQRTSTKEDNLLLPDVTFEAREPWSSRKILIDQAGNPIAIGGPQELTNRITQEMRVGGTDDIVRDKRIREQRPDEPPQPKDYRIVRIFYATDRSKTTGGYSNRREPTNSLHLGICDVTIPSDHRMGDLESPGWWKILFSWNPKKHIVLQEVSELPQLAFFDRLRTEVLKSSERSALVFIHGYCVSFEDGARRTAQLTYDLGFKGAHILYSWPSAASVEGYPVDEETINWTKPHLASFLADVVRKSQAQTVHIIAHSMGSRALARMLEIFPLSQRSPVFNEIVLAAPDVDTGEFQNLAKAIQPAAKRFTVYACRNNGN